MERAAAQPRHVVVDRLARERVAEAAPAGLGLDQQARGEQLGEAVLVADAATSVEVERPGPRPPRPPRPPAPRADSAAVRTSTASRIVCGSGHVGVERQLRSRPGRRAGDRSSQRGGELLDEERHAPGAVVERATSRGDGAVPEHLLHELRRLGAAQRLERRSRRGRGRGAGRCAGAAAGASAGARPSGSRRRRAAAARSSDGASAARNSSVASSDHWRSSSSDRGRAGGDQRTRPQRIASNSVARSSLTRASPSSGSRSARCGRSGPQSVEPAGLAARRNARSAVTTGA